VVCTSLFGRPSAFAASHAALNAVSSPSPECRARADWRFSSAASSGVRPSQWAMPLRSIQCCIARAFA
jgi:hypothetical protein